MAKSRKEQRFSRLTSTNLIENEKKSSFFILQRNNWSKSVFINNSTENDKKERERNWNIEYDNSQIEQNNSMKRRTD